MQEFISDVPEPVECKAKDLIAEDAYVKGLGPKVNVEEWQL